MLCYNVVLNTCENTELTFNNTAVSVCIFNYLSCEGDIVLEGVMRTVDHNRSKSAVDTGLADLEGIAVVKVESHINTCVLDSSLSKAHEVSVLCILSCTCGNLKDNRGLFFCSSLCNSLDDLHIVDVKSTDSVSACVCLFEHFFRSYESHNLYLLY